MGVYEVLNGYGGDGYVRILVNAANEDRAKELASAILKATAENGDFYPERYWTNLQCNLLFEDLTKEDAIDISDC